MPYIIKLYGLYPIVAVVHHTMLISDIRYAPWHVTRRVSAVTEQILREIRCAAAMAGRTEAADRLELVFVVGMLPETCLCTANRFIEVGKGSCTETAETRDFRSSGRDARVRLLQPWGVRKLTC